MLHLGVPPRSVYPFLELAIGLRLTSMLTQCPHTAPRRSRRSGRELPCPDRCPARRPVAADPLVLVHRRHELGGLLGPTVYSTATSTGHPRGPDRRHRRASASASGSRAHVRGASGTLMHPSAAVTAVRSRRREEPSRFRAFSDRAQRRCGARRLEHEHDIASTRARTHRARGLNQAETER